MDHSLQSTIKIAIVSPVGGTGRTTVTVNLATVLAGRGLKTIVIDGDLQFGDMAMAFDLKPSYTITEVAETNDLENILFYCTKHLSGVQLLAAPTRPEFADVIPNQLLSEAMEHLSEKSNVLLVETESGLTEKGLEVMDKADVILIVTNPSLHILKNTKLMMETLTALGLKEKIRVVLNKFSEASLGQKRIQEILSLDELHTITDDPKHIHESFNMGVPVVSVNAKLPFSKDLIKLADQLIGRYNTPKKKDSLFNAFKLFPRGLEGENR